MDEHLFRFDKSKKLTFIDFETYNLCLSFAHNKPWQAGLLRVVGNEIVGSHDIIIKWPEPPKFDKNTVRNLFKCSVEELNARIEQSGVTPSEAFEIIYKACEECDFIVGHNTLGFDIYLLVEFYKLMGKNSGHLAEKFIDTNCLAKAIKLEIPLKREDNLLEFQYKIFHKRQKGLKTRLSIIGKESGIEHNYEGLHDAITDLELNKKVWDVLKMKLEI